MYSQEVVKVICEAVATAEGFYVGSQTIPARANNPCDITDDGDIGYGTLGVDKITVYPTLVQGWARAHVKFQRILAGYSRVYPLTLTLLQVGLKYSGGNPNWSKNVAAKLGNGITPSMTIKEVADTLAQVN